MFDPVIVRLGDARRSADIFGIPRYGDYQVGDLMPVQLDGLTERFVTGGESIEPDGQGLRSFLESHEDFLSSVWRAAGARVLTGLN